MFKDLGRNKDLERLIVFGDIHGESLDGIKKAIDFHEPDLVLCLGDFDLADRILEWKELEKSLNKEGIKTETVCGNHDIMLSKGIWIDSIAWERYNTSLSSEVMKIKDYCLSKYLKNLTSKQKLEFNINGKRAIATHSNLRFLSQKKILVSYFGYLRDYQSTISHQLSILEKIGVDFLFRGHDHYRRVFYDENGTVKTYRPKRQREGEFLAKPSSRHIVNPGPYYQGYYLLATKESKMMNLFRESPVLLEFRNVNDFN